MSLNDVYLPLPHTELVPLLDLVRNKARFHWVHTENPGLGDVSKACFVIPFIS